MNYNDIRKMSDKELNHFLVNMQKDERRICSRCKEFILNKITINVRKNQTTRTLCTLCENCYADMLEFLGINDACWED